MSAPVLQLQFYFQCVALFLYLPLPTYDTPEAVGWHLDCLFLKSLSLFSTMRRFKERSKSFPDPSVFYGVSDDIKSPDETEVIKVNPTSQAYSWDPPRSVARPELKRPATTPHVLRRRALSEHGKSLMIQAYSDPFLALPHKTSTDTKRTKRKSRNAKRSKRSERNVAKGNGMNYFQVLSQFHEKKAIKELRKHKGRKSSAINGISAPTPISEDVLTGEDGWQTVKSKPRRPVRRQSSRPTPEPIKPEPVIEEYGDISELQYLEEDVAGSRVWGRRRKAQGFKAAKQRNYSIAKRAAQRAGQS